MKQQVFLHDRVKENGDEAGTELEGGDGNHFIREIILEPPPDDPSVPVRIDLDESFNYSKCHERGDDVRFHERNGAILDHWIEKWNERGNSIIWLSVPRLDTKTIVMSYGNKSLPSGNRGDRVFEFFDDFSALELDGVEWDIKLRGAALSDISGGLIRLDLHPFKNSGFDIKIGFLTNQHLNGLMFGSFNYVTSICFSDFQKLDRKEFNFPKKWFTGELAWLAGAEAHFLVDDEIKAILTKSLPKKMVIPMRFEISSTNQEAIQLEGKHPYLSKPGYAIRFHAWLRNNMLGVNSTKRGRLVVDWVFIRKLSWSGNQPSCTLGKEEAREIPVSPSGATTIDQEVQDTEKEKGREGERRLIGRMDVEFEGKTYPIEGEKLFPFLDDALIIPRVQDGRYILLVDIEDGRQFIDIRRTTGQ
ncbi:MAG: DUF2341 domain-containing protein [Promethearchaeota archaeon]